MHIFGNLLRLVVKPFVLAGLAGVLLSASTSNATELLAYDGFDYTPGTTIIGKGGNQPWPAITYWGSVTNPATNVYVDSVGMTYSDLETSGYSLSPNPPHNGVSRSLGASYLTSGNVYWFSILARIIHSRPCFDFQPVRFLFSWFYSCRTRSIRMNFAGYVRTCPFPRAFDRLIRKASWCIRS